MQGSPEGSHAIHANDEGELARQAALEDDRNCPHRLEDVVYLLDDDGLPDATWCKACATTLD